MSRAHIKLELKDQKEGCAIYDAWSPDFSDNGLDEELIGRLVLSGDGRPFNFEPSEKIGESFCPPEYFLEAEHLEEVSGRCRKEGRYYTTWAYLIYREAMVVSNSESLPQTRFASI